MKRFALVCILFMLICTYATPAAHGGDEPTIITGDVLWAQDGAYGSTVVSAGSTLTIRGCSVNTTSMKLLPGASLTIENASLDVSSHEGLEGENSTVYVKNSTLNIAAEIMFFANSTVEIDNSTINGGLYAVNSLINVTGTRVTAGSIGMASTSGSTLSLNNTKIKNADYGLYATASKIYMSNSTLEDNGMGLYASSMSTITITDSTIIKNGDGIKQTTGSIHILRSTISSSSQLCGPGGCGSSSYLGIGLDLTKADALLEDVNAINNTMGVRALESKMVLKSCLFDNNLWYGINAMETDISSTNSTFSNNYEAILSSMRQITWAANPLLRENNTFFGNNYSYIQEWKVSLTVVDSQNHPIPRVQLVIETVKVQGEGSANRTFTTDGNGELQIFLDSMHVLDNGLVAEYNHTIRISKTATDALGRLTYSKDIELLLQDNRNMTIELPIDYPDVMVGDITVRTSENKTELEIVVEVQNIGAAAALDFLVVATVDNATHQVVLGMIMANLTANETKEIVFKWGSPDPGAYTITIEADPDGNLLEVEKDNNIASKQYTVGKTGKLPIAQIIGGTVLLVGVLLLFRTMKKQKPDVGMKM